MGLRATLNGLSTTQARVTIPAWGAWYADVALDGEHTLTGKVTLQLADLPMTGFVLSGGPTAGRSFFRIVGGNGGWGKTIPKKSYANDAGVRVDNVIGDAATEAGETVSLSTSDRIGPAFVRPSDPACRVLEMLSPSAWYVREDGVTLLGKRTSVLYTGNAPRIQQLDKARGTIILAPATVAPLVPGAVVDGMEVVDVLHDLGPEGLRTTLWGKQAVGTSRRLAALRALTEQLDPDRKFRGVTEYRVVTQDGNRLNLQPVRVSTGMPDLQRVSVYPGVSGCKSTVALGSRVLVGFVDSDPGRPFVAGFEDPDGGGFIPLTTSIDATATVSLGLGALPVARTGDLAAGIFPIITTQVKTLA